MDTKIIQLSSGKGPAECCLAVALALKALLLEAKALGLDHLVLSRFPGPQNGTLASATLKLSGPRVATFAESWEGAVLWICQSPYRRMHKRKNWFIGIGVYDESQLPAWNERDISYQTLRSSGPGGQHVNKTESAVRAIHNPSGLSVTASDSRSQLQNKKLATERLHQQFVQWQRAQRRSWARINGCSTISWNGAIRNGLTKEKNLVVNHIMETSKPHLEIRRKKDLLHDVSMQLKAHFIGLDSIIDEIMNLVSAWYIFPQAQLRPTVINLWGMTGSGKTALVEKLVELLDHKKLYAKIDMGEFESDSASWLKSVFTDDLEFFDGEPALLCLDEFQFARTIDANGNEQGKDKLRVIWDLLDNGQITYLPYNNTYMIRRADVCVMNLLLAKEEDVRLVNGVVTADSEEAFLRIFKGFYFNDSGRNNEALSLNYFISRDFINGLYYLYDDERVTSEILEEELKRADLDLLIELVVAGRKTRKANKQLNLSKALIFVLGNLDEAYNMSHTLNPDISADELHESTLRINIGNIKAALKKRFRNEQIARLGNNHIIYRAFTNAHFKELIRRELARVNRFVEDQFQFSVSFHESLSDVVYREGVYPAQGTRPVLTTVKNLVEAWISKVVVEVVDKAMPVALVEWSYIDERYVFVFKDQAGGILNLYEEKVLMKIDSLRKIGNRHTQAHVAVHEAGHAILAALTLRILPSVVVSKTAADNCEGFCMINFPEELTTRHTLKKDIVISLGGFVAEKLIFGEEHTSSGVYGDIENASELANKAVKYYGMGSDPIYIAVQDSSHNSYFFNKEVYTQQALELVKEAQAEAEKLLNENKLLLLKMASYLVDHNRLEEAGIGELMRQYGKDDWIREEGFVKKENYFSFEHTLNQQLEQLVLEQDIR